MTIFFTISRGSLIRNFFHTGVVSMLLERGLRVVVLLPENVDKNYLTEHEHKNLILEPLIDPKNLKFKRLIREFFKGAIFTKTVYVRYKYANCGKNPSKILFLPRMIFLAPLRFVPGFKKFIRWIDFKLNPQPEHDYLFEKHKPDLVFATTAQTDSDVGVLKSAKRFKVPTVDMPKSWDNPSKLLFDVKTDYMIVWSEFMRKQVLSLQGYKEKEIIVTGAPQFDYYTHKENLWTREEFCRKFNLNPQKKIILYGSIGGHYTREVDYVKLIKEFIDNGELSNVQVLIRPHVGYMRDEEKFTEIEGYDGFVVDKTAQKDENFKDKWDTSKNHLPVLFNSLYHADVCINMASTLSIDAILNDTEVININFDIDKTTPFSLSPRRFYISDYIIELMNFDVIRLVKSEEELKQALKAILEQGEKREKNKEEFIKYFVYKRDGKAGERIVNNLINIVNKT